MIREVPVYVSVLYGLGSGGVARAVTAAHDAVSDALHYLERHATFARRGHAGERSIETAGLIGAAFRTSDPVETKFDLAGG